MTATRIAFVALALGALVLGYVGLHDFLGTRPEYGTRILDLVYWDLQLFVLDSAPLQAGGDLPVTLEIARFAAPAATLSALFATVRVVLASQITLARARYSRRHSIVCGTGPAMMLLARELVAEGRRVVLVDPGAEPGRTVSGLPPGVLRLDGDPRDRSVLEDAGIGRAREVMALTTDSAFNGEVAITVRAMAAALPSRLTCYAEVADPELCAELAARALGATTSSRVQIEFFSRHERAARRLLDRHPMTPVAPVGPAAAITAPADQQPAVLVVGDGQLKDALVAELRRRWTGATGATGASGATGDHLALRIVAAGDVDTLRAPGDLYVEAGDGAPRPPSHVFVCIEEEAAALKAGLKIARLAGPDVRHVVVAAPVSTVFGRELADPGSRSTAPAAAPADPAASPPGGPTQPVWHNVTETVYSSAAVRRGDVEDIARAAHDAYVAACRERGETPETNPSMVPWDTLPDYKKDDNRAQAADIGRKLAAIGAVIVPASGHEEPFAFHDAEVEMLARMEHERWVGHRRERGWSYAPDKDEDARRHPDIVDWEDLPAASKDKDRGPVREIPRQLRAAGFTVVRAVR